MGEDDPIYKAEKWTNESVAMVSIDHTSIDIWVSSANKHLEKLVARARRRSNEAVESIKNYYLEHISFYAYMSHQAKQNKEIINGPDGETAPDEILKQITEADSKYACETVCGMLTDLFDYVVISASEEVEI